MTGGGGSASYGHVNMTLRSRVSQKIPSRLHFILLHPP